MRKQTMQTNLKAILVAASLAVSAHLASASVIYTVVDYPALQNGDTVTGTITTDGSVGTFGWNSPEILGWEFTVTGSSNPFTISGTANHVSGYFTVTPTTIKLDPTAGQTVEFIQGNSYVGYGTPRYDPTFGFSFPGEYNGVANSQVAYSATIWLAGSDDFTLSGFTIATAAVPEPSALLLLAGGLTSLLWAVRRRQA